MARNRRINLRPGFDQDVYQIINKLESANEGKPFKTIVAAYDAIKRSNSSLSRQKKRPLEDSIDRVLQFRKQELAEPDSEADLDQPEPTPAKPDDDRFLLNRQMTKHWHPEPTPQTSSHSTEDRTTKKRRRQSEGEERTVEGESSITAPVLTPSQSIAQMETDAAPVEKSEKTAPKKSQKSSRHKVEQPSKPVRLGGVADVCDTLFKQTRYVLKWPELYAAKRWHKVPGLVLSGLPGTGKKSMIQSLASKLEVPLISLTGCFEDPERVEKSLNDAFEDAMKIAPCIIYIEHLDWAMPKPGNNSHNDSGRRVLSIFIRQMRRLQEEQSSDRHVLAMATTSKITDVDPEVLKFGLFERIIQVGRPDGDGRLEILKLVTEDLELSENVDLVEVSKMTHGFVGVDFKNLIGLVEQIAAMRIMDDLDTTMLPQDADDDAMEVSSDKASSLFPPPPPASLTMDDFKLAIKDFVPSLRRHGFTPIPSVTWDQVGALHNAREQLDMSVIGPIKNPELYKSIGLGQPTGCILWGPPGCGKTLVAQAVANEAQASFILINGPELLNKYVGESERAVREVFDRARSSTPCILFFDEIDSVLSRREGSSNEASARVVNALLTELDGVKDRSGIYVIGTTNRPDLLDQAVLRPGRLSIRIFFDLPTASERAEILRAIYRTNHPNWKEDDLAVLDSVAQDDRCKDFSGADLGALHVKAGEAALKRWQRKEKLELKIDGDDWEHALNTTRHTVTNPERYRSINRQLEHSN